MERMSRRLLTVLLLAFAGVALAPGAPAGAELVLLQGGDVLKVKAYELGESTARLTLPSGGVLTVSLLRIERVLADEIVPSPEPPPPAPPGELALAFAESDAQPETPYGAEILAAARRHGVNPAVVAAVMRVESSYNPKARSHAGARGLMQLMPATAARFGVAPEELYTPERNLEAGVRYLRFLLDRFGNDPVRVFAAYNAGENAVDRHGGVPPYRETRDYVRKVMRHLGLEAPSPPAAPTPATALASSSGR
jgi:soluble lytic murein transglycosylase-like protein